MTVQPNMIISAYNITKLI